MVVLDSAAQLMLPLRRRAARVAPWFGPAFVAAISNLGDVLAARDATNRQGSDLVLDNLTPPEHPTDPTFGTLKDRLRDLPEVAGLIETEEVSEDEREVTVVFWVDAESEVEAQIVGTIAYWSGCWSAEMPLPVGGSIEPLPA